LRNGRMTGKAALAAAKRASSTFITSLGVAALAVAVAAVPVQAKKQQARPDGIADIGSGEPLFLVVSTGSQKVDIYRGTNLVTTSQVSTGTAAHPTFLGAFSIIEKQRWHHSNMYSGAPMPWMNRITWSGTALHAGVVPGYPASHGCIRLPYSFAPKLYDITSVGDNVVISRDRPAPVLIEHPNLFQPLPPPPPPVMVKQEQPPRRQSSNDAEPTPARATHPGMLAKAELSGVTTDIPSSIEAEAADQGGHAASAPAPAGSPDLDTGSAAANEDTHTHAIDPYVGGAAAGTDDHASDTPGTHKDQARLEGSAGDTNRHAVSDDNEDNRSSIAKAPTAEPPLAAASTDIPKDAAVVAASAPTEAPAIIASAVTAAAASMIAQPSAVASIVVVPPQPAAPVQAPAPEVTIVPVAVTALLPPPSEPSAQPAPDAPPSIVATKLVAGANAAAIQAAEPRSTAPLRILVTRRSQRDRVIGVQNILADLGYLDRQDFDGTLGRPTASAIKAFQKANGMSETGAFTEELVKKAYEVAGKGEPPVGHIFVRQEFSRVFDAAVGLRNPDEPLGTHVYTTLKFAPGDTKARWMAVTVQGGSPESVLARIEIPDDVRQRISERLTPGSTLIVGDTSINAARLPKGGDFVVLARYGSPKTVDAGSDGADQPKKKKVRRYNYSYSYPRAFQQPRSSKSFTGWPW
jgi:peptidoglycan hydrolase-like protein with peptidoglycan-binding domain